MIDESQLLLPYQQIKTLDGTDSMMAFNMGSPGVEQKISIMGYNRQTRKPFFAKFSNNERTRQLTEHEASIYEKLKGTDLTPELMQLTKQGDAIYMKTEYIQGVRPADLSIDEHILNLAEQLGNYHLGLTNMNERELKTCLSHGDFCPWNILVDNGRYRLVDWELAEERPLGYDLFTYICNVSALFEPQKPLIKSIKQNKRWIESYFHRFSIVDCTQYLIAFATEKLCYERNKSNEVMANKYEQLKKMLMECFHTVDKENNMPNIL